MRERKFKIWDKVTKTMHTSPNDGFKIELSGSVSQHDTWCTGDVVILDYTGLKDKNGVEIYEGDVIGIFYQNELTTALIIFDEETFGFRTDFFFKDDGVPVREWWSLDHKHHNIYEVIGNIYESPELLEQS